MEDLHRQRILEQFTKQAVPFSEMKGHTSRESLDLVVQLSGANSRDEVLDVACGPGIVACAFAPKVRRVTGIDLTPAMIERARKLQKEKGFSNLDWIVGDVQPLPYKSGSFSLAVTRYSFHHFPDPRGVLKEMIRVTRAGGRVMVVDVFTSEDPGQAEAYNHLEKLRDPSHVRALSLKELLALAQNEGLQNIQKAFYKVEMELEEQLQASFPNPGDADKIRGLMKEDLGRNLLGLGVRQKTGKIYFAYPIVILSGERI